MVQCDGSEFLCGGGTPTSPPKKNLRFSCYAVYGVYLDIGDDMKIDKNVPMPQPKNVVVYPYEDMEVGDSFVVNGDSRYLLATVCNRNGKYAKKLGMRFTAKKVEGGVRVWRLE